MTTSLDGGYTLTTRREPPHLAASSLAPAASAPAQTGPAAVPPTEAADGGARLASGKDQQREAAERDAAAAKKSPPTRVGSYDMRLTYENEQARTFLDVINPENDRLLMRFPPESLVEYLKGEQAGSTAATAGGRTLNTEA
ncbi:MAG: hypothetical protein MUE49_06075 [Rhodospirillales bacterium]|nr:hypothetical protein [Rhodospirillales bacterium]